MSGFLVKVNSGAGLASVGYEAGTLEITQARMEPSTCRFDVLLTGTSHPYKMDQAVEVKNAADTVTYFSGTITAHPTRFETPGPVGASLRYVAIEAQGIDRLLPRVRISRRYTDQAAGDIIKDIVSKDLDSLFTTTAVGDGPVIAEIAFDGDSAAQAFERIEEAARGFFIVVDAAGAITFDYSDNATAAAFDLDEDTSLYEADSITIQRLPGEYYNRVVIFGPQQEASTGEITETLPSLPTTNKKWSVSRPISKFLDGGVDKIYDTTNDDLYTAGRGGKVSEALGTYDFLYTPGSEVLEIQTTLGATSPIILQVTYVPRAPAIFAFQNTFAIEARGGYPQGVYESPRLTIDRYIPVEELVDMAVAYLERHQWRAFTSVSFRASEITSGVSLVYPGESIGVNLSEEDIDATFRIERVTYRQSPLPDKWTMTIVATQGISPTASNQSAQMLRQLAAPKTEPWTALEQEAVLQVVPWRDDIDVRITVDFSVTP